MASPTPPTIEQHPDILAMRMRYEATAESTVAQFVEGLGLLTGVYLAASPWIVGFNTSPTITVNNLITGIVVAALATGFASAFSRTHGLVWVAPLIGVWTVVSPWAVSGGVSTAAVIINNVIVGGICIVLGLVAISAGFTRTRR